MTPEAEAVASALARLAAAAGVDPGDWSPDAVRRVLAVLGGPKLGQDLDVALRAWVVRGSGVVFAHPGEHGPVPRMLLANRSVLLIRTHSGGGLVTERVPYPGCVEAAVLACGGTGDSPPGRRKGGTRRKREGGAA